ncbi:MAG: glycosyltransferase [Elusimicrobia bacterium]|nr:glycosyltransferase [Elusimicrobiota bacterium]
MKLAIVNPTGGGMSGGYKKYLERMLPMFERDPKIERILCAAPRDVPVCKWFSGLSKIRFADCKPFSALPFSGDNALLGELDRFKPDIVFIPIERYIKYSGAPLVTMVSNMAPMANNYDPGPLSEKLRQALQRRLAKKAVRLADRVIAPSHFVKNYLVKNWGLSEDKISVIYFGADDTGAIASVKPKAIEQTGWDNFIFTIGSIEKYRGLEDILRAMELKNFNLVICSSARPQMRYYERELKEFAVRKGISKRILWISDAGYDELLWCYRNASAVIVASRIEAGPNIALEAMSCGAASIAADNPPLPEFFGDSAMYYAPGDSRMLAEKISEVLSWGVAKREAFSQTAKTRAQRFCWNATTSQTLNVFEETLQKFHQVSENRLL